MEKETDPKGESEMRSHVCWNSSHTTEEKVTTTKKKYEIPPQGRKWVLHSVNSAWRSYKHDLKQDHFVKYEDDATRWANRSRGVVPDHQMRALFRRWNTQAAQQQVNPVKQPPSRAEMFVLTHKRRPCKVYKDNGGSTVAKIDKVQSQQDKINAEDGANAKNRDAFAEVMPDEHPARLCLYGRGVCLKDLKGKAKMGDIQVPSNVMDATKAELKADVTKEVLKELISKLGAIVPSLSNLRPEVLQGLVGSPSDAGSAPNQNGASSSGARSS